MKLQLKKPLGQRMNLRGDPRRYKRMLYVLRRWCQADARMRYQPWPSAVMFAIQRTTKHDLLHRRAL